MEFRDGFEFVEVGGQLGGGGFDLMGFGVRRAEVVVIAGGHAAAFAIGETELATGSAGADGGICWLGHEGSHFFEISEWGIRVFADGYQSKGFARGAFCKYVRRPELHWPIFG
jgi:hypothetical protein